MDEPEKLEISLPTDREIVFRRLFAAPVEAVWRAYSEPALLKQWFGPKGWSMVECEMDRRVGGRFRLVLRTPDEKEMGIHGVYKEHDPPRKSVHLEYFEDFPENETQVTNEFSAEDGKTRLTVTVLYVTKAVRDRVADSGMERSAAESYDRLEELLASGLSKAT